MMTRGAKCRYCGATFARKENVTGRQRVCPDCQGSRTRMPEGLGLRTQEEVAAELGLSTPMVNKIEARALARIRGDAELRELFVDCLGGEKRMSWAPTAEECVRGWRMEIARWKECMGLAQEEGLAEEVAEFQEMIVEGEELVSRVVLRKHGAGGEVISETLRLGDGETLRLKE